MGQEGDVGANVEQIRIYAVVDGNLCGTANVFELAGSLVYKIPVSAAAGDNGCGWYGDEVVFVDGDGLQLGEAKWDNRLSQCVGLGNVAGGQGTDIQVQFRCSGIDAP